MTDEKTLLEIVQERIAQDPYAFLDSATRDILTAGDREKKG